MVFYACLVGAVREPPLHHPGTVKEQMQLRRLDIWWPVRGAAAVALLSFLTVAFAPAVQNAGPGNPPRHLTEQDLRAAFGRAQQALAAKDYADAERGFKEFLKLDPNSAAAYTNLGVVYMRTGKPDDAIRALETAKKLDPSMVGVDLNLGLLYYRKQDFKDAVPYFERLVKAQPDSVQARYLLGMSHFMLRDYRSAVADLEPIRDQGAGRSRFPLHARDSISASEAK